LAKQIEKDLHVNDDIILNLIEKTSKETFKFYEANLEIIKVDNEDLFKKMLTRLEADYCKIGIDTESSIHDRKISTIQLSVSNTVYIILIRFIDIRFV
jgi:hypothetical protein